MLWKSDFYLKVEGGIAVVIPSDGVIDRQEPEGIQLSVTEDGLSILLGEYEIPVPENLFEYLADNRLITFYIYNGSRILLEPAFAVEISRDLFIECKGIYFYKKKEMEVQQEEVERKKEIQALKGIGIEEEENIFGTTILPENYKIEDIKKDIMDEYKRATR